MVLYPRPPLPSQYYFRLWTRYGREKESWDTPFPPPPPPPLYGNGGVGWCNNNRLLCNGRGFFSFATTTTPHFTENWIEYREIIRASVFFRTICGNCFRGNPVACFASKIETQLPPAIFRSMKDGFVCFSRWVFPPPADEKEEKEEDDKITPRYIRRGGEEAGGGGGKYRKSARPQKRGTSKDGA